MNKFNLFMIFVILGIGFEFVSVPIITNSHPISMGYDIIKNEENAILLEIPNSISFLYMYYQTYHKKPIVNGYGKISNEQIKFIQSTPIIRDLLSSNFPKNIEQKNLSFANSYGTKILSENKITHIIIHKKYFNQHEINLSKTYLEKNLKLIKEFSDSELDIYILPDSNIKDNIYKNKSIFLYQIGNTIDFTANGWGDHYLSEGWSSSEGDWGTWTDGDVASLSIFLETLPNCISMNFLITPYITEKILNQNILIEINKKLIQNPIILENSSWEEYKVLVPSGYLRKGLNDISFILPNASEISSRKLGIAFKKWNLSECFI